MEIPKDDSVSSVEEYRRFFRHSLMQACEALGLECKEKSRLQEAVQYFETFLFVAKQVGGEWETRALGMLGTTLYCMGRTDKAVSHLEALADIAKQNGNKYDEAQAYLHLARCYCHFGQNDKAIRYCKWYLRYSKYNQNENMRRLEALAHLTIGYSCCQLQRLEEAFGHFKASLDIAKVFDYKEVEVKASIALGHFDKHRGHYEEALKCYQKSAAIAKENGDRGNEVLASHHVGECFFRLSQHEKAVDHLLAVCKMAEQAGYNVASAQGHLLLGQCYLFGLGQYDKAEHHLKRAVLFDQELFDSALRQDCYKVSMCEHGIDAYRMLIWVLLLQKKAEEGLLVAERGRSRALAELMTTCYSLKNSEANEGKALSLSEIREVVKLLDTTVIFFSLLGKNDPSIIWSWYIKSDGQVTDMPCGIVSEETTSCEAQASPAIVKGTDLMSILAETRQFLIKKGRGNGEYEDAEDYITRENNRPIVDEEEQEKIQNYEKKRKDALRRLYQILCPRLQERTGGSQVVIVSDGPVHLIPFAALIDENGHYLAESLQVRHVPSLATAKLIMEHRVDLEGGTSPLIVGDPALPKLRLPCAKEEALMISKLLGVEPLIGENATKEKVLQSLEKAQLIHIAAHGDMERGEILLASNLGSKGEKEDYMLMLSDLEGKRLRASLVVLSCCHSAKGDVKADGVIGIARAFIGAGARSVLVALWAISDEGTLHFMKAFYQHFSRGLKASECLNKAMEVMRNSKNFFDPHFWAPFILIGDDVTLSS